MSEKKTYAIIGSGSRGINSFGIPLVEEYQETAQLVALFDVSPARMDAACAMLKCDIPRYTDMEKLMDEVNPDALIICSNDDTHSEFVIKGFETAKRVYSEKPLCITAHECRAILAAKKKYKGQGFVTHNMRYGPAMIEIKRLIQTGKIGKVLSIDFTETLDRNHGADYFRRWHKYKKNSGGLLIHKASHHFDMINWFADSKPDTLTAMGGTLFYGKNGKQRGERCSNCEHTSTCAFFNDYKHQPDIQALYFDAEHDNDYVRDGCVFDPSITTEDQASVIYRYENDVRATYSLNAYASYEGMLIKIEGEKGCLEFKSVKRTLWAARFKAKDEAQDYYGGPEGFKTLTFFEQDKAIEELTIPKPTRDGGHGGSDPALRDDFFLQPWGVDNGEQMASIEDALQAVLIGVAANDSIAQNGKTIKVQSLLEDNYVDASGY